MDITTMVVITNKLIKRFGQYYRYGRKEQETTIDYFKVSSAKAIRPCSPI